MSGPGTIETKRLRLRPRLDDTETWHRRVFGDVLVTRFLPPRPTPRPRGRWTRRELGPTVADHRLVVAVAPSVTLPDREASS